MRSICIRSLLVFAIFFMVSFTSNAQPNPPSHIFVVAGITPSLRPKIVGSTNLPDGAKINLDIVCPLMYCNKFWEKDFPSVVVQHGSFESPTISQDGAPINPGRYVINVVIEYDQDTQVEMRMFDLGYTKMGMFSWDFTTDVGRIPNQ